MDFILLHQYFQNMCLHLHSSLQPATVYSCAFHSCAPLLTIVQEKHQIVLRLRKIHLHYVVRDYRCLEKPFLLNQIVNFSHCCGDIFQSLFSFMLNIPYIFLNDFKNPPKASEYTSLVVNYVLSGNLIVIVLDNWILCCVDTCCFTSIAQV